jgi:hypothetical protein
MPKPKEIVFMPGCFDEFDGTQQELDDFVAHLQGVFQNEDFLANTQPVDMKTLQDTDPETYAKLVSRLNQDHERKLQ